MIHNMQELLTKPSLVADAVQIMLTQQLAAPLRQLQVSLSPEAGKMPLQA